MKYTAHHSLSAVVALTLLASSACERTSPSAGPEDARPAGSPSGQAETVPAAAATAKEAAGAAVAIGSAAPDFKLKSLDGEAVSLSQFKGKTVVLEWFNPGCPFVKQAHTEGTLKGLAKSYRDKDVVWLAINSGAPNKQGHGEEANREGKEKLGMDYPILFDEDGKVGSQYGAERTPHMMIVDKEGILRYRGALDNTQGGDVADVELVEYVKDALTDVQAGSDVRTTETKAWGCSVKYANN